MLNIGMINMYFCVLNEHDEPLQKKYPQAFKDGNRILTFCV